MSDQPSVLRCSTHPDRILDLEQELESHLVALMDRAREAGWHQEEVAEAVTSLARNYVLRLDANLETDRQMAMAMKDGRQIH
jgi:hypothetical protein